jgi:leucyl aminopeptidase
MYIHFKKDEGKLGDTIQQTNTHTTVSLGRLPLTPKNVVYLMSLIFKTANETTTIDILTELYDVQIKAFLYNSYTHINFKKNKVKKIKISLNTSNVSHDVLDLLEKNKMIMSILNKTRDIIDTPPDIMYPQSLLDYIVNFSSKNNLSILETYDEKRLQRDGLNGIYSVGKGGTNKPCMIVLEYDGTNKSEKSPVVFVGKGVTYDSGGYSVKRGSHMKNMKHDKTGVAIITGVMGVIANLKLKCRVIAILPLSENVISRDSYKPDEVIISHSGLSVEVFNTDAEGRLLLMDGISLAHKYNPKIIIDVATLTGMSVFCGKMGGIFGNNQELAWTLQRISSKEGDSFWVMPPLDDFIEDSKNTHMANVKNEGYSCSSISMMGAAFLNNFVNSKIPWIHIDLGDSKSLYEKYDGDTVAKSNSFFTLISFLKHLSKV